jgi:SAM-dependent methyltransferase
MSQADLDKWEGRYAAEGLDPGAPEPFVEAATSSLAPGAALDVAGGLGRHALLIAARGFDTRLVDISPRGLRAAEGFAKARGVSLRIEARDLEADGLPDGRFDLVVVAWFLLDARAWSELPSRLSAGGHLVYVQPTTTNLERHPRPSRRFLFAPGELEAKVRAAGLRVVRSEEGWDARGHHTARLLAAR